MTYGDEHMNKTIIKIVTVTGIILILFSIGCSGINLALKWREDWKRKNTRIILPRYERPEIRDRSGNLLIGNRERTGANDRVRYAATDGKSAAGLLGFTEFSYGKEIGKSGIEKMIDKKQVPGTPVYISIDQSIQKTAENWMEQLASMGKYNYIYAICLNSGGELLAAAQRPVVDINNRQQIDGGTFLMPAVYVFPVPDNFMKLLGSSSNATAQAKKKFNFHQKTGIFFPEARGRIRGFNAPEDAPDAQTSTAFNYLLAYIGIAEKKPAPALQIFSSGRQNTAVLKDKIRFFAAGQDKNTIIALGKAPATDGTTLYFLICMEVQDQKISQKIITALEKF